MPAGPRRNPRRATQIIRTTLSLPVGLLTAVDHFVRTGRARSRNALVAQALRRELAAERRREIDMAYAAMAGDEDANREALQVAEEFAQSDWEVLRLADSET